MNTCKPSKPQALNGELSIRLEHDPMNFKQEFLEALNARKKHDSLLQLVSLRQSQFANAKQIYDVLQEIWLELGFDEKIDPSPLRDELEFVMERVWYECPA
jgi:hypothetical protein